MIWKNLKKVRCPECSNPLKLSGDMHSYDCEKCGYWIRKEKFDQIVLEMETKDYSRFKQKTPQEKTGWNRFD